MGLIFRYKSADWSVLFWRASDQAESRWRAKTAGSAPRRPEELASVRPEGGEEAVFYTELKPGLRSGS